MLSVKAARFAGIVTTLLLLTAVSLCFGQAYTDLEPGVSTKRDVDKLLGRPVKELVRAVKYEYAPLQDDVLRVLVEFHGNGQVVKTIEIYPRDSYYKGQYLVWFELERPDKSMKDKNDRLVEYYTSDGVAFHYSGPDDSSVIEFFSYFDRSSNGSRSQAGPVNVPSADGTGYLLIDDFNQENKGSGAYNYSAFSKWNVAGGTVDLIGNGFWDYHPQNGLHVDLDGTTRQGGTLVSKSGFSLEPGTYRLSFDLAGNPFSGPNKVTVALGNSYREDFHLAVKAPMKKVTRDITVTSPEFAKLSFKQDGGDNEGLLLDNVALRKISGSPSPVAVVPKSIPEGVNYYLRKADKAIENKDWTEAKRLIDEGLRKYPNSANLWHTRATYYFKSTNEPGEVRAREAEQSIFRAYNLDPSGKHAAEVGWLNLQFHKNCLLSISYFEEAERKGYAGEMPSLLFWMGSCYEKTGMHSSARTYYRRFLDTAPGHEKQAEAQAALDRLR